MKYFHSYKDISELIYFNEFLKDKKFVKILKNENNLDLISLRKQINLQFQNSFLFYKTLGLKEASFYNAKNNFILSMEDNYENNFISKITSKVVNNKKDLIDYKIENGKLILLFSKPIFDEKLSFLGVINLEFDFDNLINNLEKNSDIKFRLLLSDSFHLNEKIFFNMKDNQREELISIINTQKEFSMILSNELTKVPVVFIKIFDSDFYKNSLYLLAYDEIKNNEISKINDYFDFMFAILIFTLIIILYLIYRTNYFIKQNEIINQKYEILYEQVDNYIIKVETDLQGNIIFATKPFYKITGYPKEEILGKNINILRHLDVSGLFFDNMWKDLRAGKIWEGEIKNKDKYGNSYWLRTVIFPKYNFNKELEGYSSIRINITDTKQLEKINRLLKEDLSNKLNDIKIKDKTLIDSTKVQLMSKILDSFSHQWKVPISKISFESEKLHKIKDDTNNSSLTDIEKNIKSQLKNLSDMLNEIKYLFNTKNSEKNNLLSIVQESIFSLKDEFYTHNIKVKFDIKSEINMLISQSELKSILINIFKNCIEQTVLNKAENVTIFVSSIAEDLDENNDVIIKIEDNIKGENKKNIIDEMLSSDEEKYFDTHLYLSKLFIEKNKGLFWCNNTIYNTVYFIKLHKQE
ncbi:MAG: PAS domain S-box protein [Aliarcobacter sp.]|nr:PAS domain S-box protein [Aliarcobacter sp.]